MDDIAGWRRKIDDIDGKLLELLNARAACAIEIGGLKRAMGLDIHNPAREDDIIRRVCELNEGPLDDDAVRSIFQKIIEECRKREGK